MNNDLQAMSTKCVHAGIEPEPVTGAVMTPIFQTSTYAQSAPGEHKGFDYSRGGNPTRQVLEASLAALEDAEHAISFSSGLTAIQSIIHGLEPGDHVVVCDDVYGGTGRLFRQLYAKFGIEFDFVSMVDAAAIEGHFQPNTKMVWIETPTNPLLQVINISEIAAFAKNRGVCVVVDNTFATPIFQQPLSLGADIVIHSVTKYIGGHSDLVGGAVMTSHPQWAEKIRFFQFAAGGVNSPLECFLLLRSIKTLAIRMEKHQENALEFARALVSLKGVKEVIYPGLANHPQHALAQKQMSGFSGIVSVRLAGDLGGVTRVVQALKLITLAESLGGVESLVNHPETMTHASVPPEHRKKIGITGDLLRFSIGIESAKDLVEDVTQALKELDK